LRCFIFLREARVIDFTAYRYDPGSELEIDLFVVPDGQPIS
jgi:hypothetical protein